MKENILIFTSEFPPQPGGIGNHALYLSLELYKNGAKVSVMTDQRADKIAVDISFDQKLPIDVRRIPRSKPVIFTYISRIFTAFELARNKEVILASGKFPLWLVACLSLFFKDKKYAAVLHGSEIGAGGFFGKLVTQWSLKRFDTLIAVSNFTKQLALNHNPNLSITVINNGFSSSGNSSEVVSKSEKLNLITVGNVTSRKGQQNVINALPLILKKYPSVTYHIVGLPTEKDAFSKLACKLGVNDALVFHGVVSDQELQQLLNQADVFLMLSDHLSNGDVEGFGIAVIEANNSYLPAIGSINSGIADAILDGVTGKLVDPHNPEAILEALNSILNDYENYSLQAKTWAEKFEWKNIINYYIKELEL